jgi:hypothetical protein
MGRIVMSNFGRDNRFRNAAIITVFVMMVAAFAFAPLAAAATNYFADDFESGLGNWVVSGYDWGVTESDSRSQTHSVTDSPNGNYPVNGNATMTLAHPIDLTGSVSPVLSYWHKDYMPHGWDLINVEVSTNDGLTWTPLKSYGAVTISTWTKEELDLSSFKTSSVLIRFGLRDNGDGYVADGWYIDDVEIKEKDPERLPFPFSDDFEHGLGKWEVSGYDWDLTESDSRSVTHSVTDSPSGNYPVNANATMTLAHPIDLTGTVSPVLSFWHKDYMPHGWDVIYVEVSKDGGLSWTALQSPYGAVTNSTWTKEQLDLSSFKTSSVLIRFGLRDNGDGYVADGWYIDDVEIREKDPDIIAPETTIISGPTDASCVTSASVTLGWSGSDNYAGALVYSYKMDGNDWSLFDPATSITFDALSEGSHTVSVKARDEAGNEDPTPAVLTFKIDSVAPAILSIQAAPTLDSAIITWTTNEPGTSQVEYGDSANYGFVTPIQPALVTNHSVTIPGLNQSTAYHYRVKYRDACGNESVSTDYSFSTAGDVTPPDTSFTSGPPNNGKACDSTVNLCWTGTDDFTSLSGLQYSYNLDNGSWSDWTMQSCHSFAGLTDGPHTVLVKAKDSSGNTDATPAALNFYIDATVPELSNIASSTRDYNVTITWNTSEPATAQVDYGETAAYGMSSALNSTMTGAHAVTIDGLTPKTTYHYRVKSNDGCREVASGDMTFTTTDILYPNLRIIQQDVPGTVRALERIDVKWLERNDGPGSAQGSWVDKLFLSTDQILDPQDTLLGEITFSDGLAWEIERWRTVTLTMPMMPSGTYYVIVQTDANSVITETNENDNTLVKRIDYLTVKQLTAAPDQITISLHPGETANGEIDLINLGETALTGITAAIEASSSNISIQVVPPSSISGKTVQKVSYAVSASDDSVKKSSPVIVFSTSVGQTASVTFSITVNPGYPNLVSNPGYLETTMVRGSQTIAEFEVTNTGAAAASNLKIILPATDWLSLITPNSVASLGPGEKMKVGLALKPGTTLPLGPYTGNIAISADNASATVSFRFTAVSDKISGLKIVAKDEFTYFADDHPPVTGASVKIKNPFDGTMVAEGQTDANGQFAKLDLFEGFYSIEVSAEKHGTYNATVQLIAGQVRELTAFLPRQLVTYTWKVVPVQTDDKYVVTLEAVFETHVPAPVITVEPTILDLSKLQYDANGRAVVNYTVTNHGLIAANGATIKFGSHPDYKMIPVSENIGEVPPMTSMVVPVVVNKLPSATTNPSADCGIPVVVGYYYVCENNQWRLVTVYAVTNQCPQTETPSIAVNNPFVNDPIANNPFVNSPNPFGSGGGGDGRSPGGGWRGWGVMISAPSIEQSIGCVPPSCRDECCRKEFEKPKAAGAFGATICCNGTLIMCTRDWPLGSDIVKNILKSCVIEHEGVHMDHDDTCPSNPNVCEPDENPPPVKSPWTPGDVECEAYRSEVHCLENALPQCDVEKDTTAIEECKRLINCRTIQAEDKGIKYKPDCFSISIKDKTDACNNCPEFKYTWCPP